MDEDVAPLKHNKIKMIEDLSEIRLDPKTRRQINKRYREQMKKYAPALVQSHAPPATKALMVMLTSIWEEPHRSSKPKRKPRRRRSKGQNGGYSVYDLRVLKLGGEWIRREVSMAD